VDTVVSPADTISGCASTTRIVGAFTGFAAKAAFPLPAKIKANINKKIMPRLIVLLPISLPFLLHIYMKSL
jgi:hypothetical protein